MGVSRAGRRFRVTNFLEFIIGVMIEVKFGMREYFSFHRDKVT